MATAQSHFTRPAEGRLETSVENAPAAYLPPPTRYQVRTHEPHHLERARLIRALAIDHDRTASEHASTDTTRSGRLAIRLNDCCRLPQLHASDARDEVMIVERRCRSRVCPLCAAARAADVTGDILQLVQTMDSPRMLTLTLASTNRPLEDELDRLTSSFRKLRQRKAWREHVHGGVWVIEVTLNESTGQWHPHAHALIDGKFWHQGDIANAWQSVTGDSRVVDIRMVHGRRDAARYVSKYVAKGCDISKLPDDRIAEYAAAIASRRLHQPFGTCHGVIVRDDVDKSDLLDRFIPEWQDAGTAAQHGDQRAAALYDTLISLAADWSREVPSERIEKLHRLTRHALKELDGWHLDRLMQSPSPGAQGNPRTRGRAKHRGPPGGGPSTLWPGTDRPRYRI